MLSNWTVNESGGCQGLFKRRELNFALAPLLLLPHSRRKPQPVDNC